MPTLIPLSQLRKPALYIRGRINKKYAQSLAQKVLDMLPERPDRIPQAQRVKLLMKLWPFPPIEVCLTKKWKTPRYDIALGNHRYVAAKILGLPSIPALIKTPVTSAQAHLAQLLDSHDSILLVDKDKRDDFIRALYKEDPKAMTPKILADAAHIHVSSVSRILSGKQRGAGAKTERHPRPTAPSRGRVSSPHPTAQTSPTAGGFSTLLSELSREITKHSELLHTTAKSEQGKTWKEPLTKLLDLLTDLLEAIPA